MTKVLLYGTSANPPTGRSGHMGAIEFFLTSQTPSLRFDEIWLLPVYQHIYASKRSLAAFEHRVAMCQLAVDELVQSLGAKPSRTTSVCVKESERELVESLVQANTNITASELRVGTIDLIRFLMQQHPQVEFSMLLGADTFGDLLQGKWKQGDELFRLIRFVVMERKGCTSVCQLLATESAANPTNQWRQNRVQTVQIPTLADTSSTMARQLCDPGQLQQMLMSSVADYVVRNKLYAFEQQQ